MTVTPPEPLSEHLYLYGFHEEGLTRFLLDHVSNGMTFVDVGAHYGYFTLLGAHLVGQTGSVHAFEPTPSTYRILERNVADRANVRINPTAVWSSEGELELRDEGIEGSMFNSVIATRATRGKGTTSVRVSAVSLDRYVERLGLKPGFVKIDAESAETEVIRGLASTTLRLHRPLLTVEVGDVPGQPVSSRRLLEMICEGYRYQPFEFSGGEVRPHRLRQRYEYSNILLVAE